MYLYRHELSVVVFSAECSPDAIVKRIENSFRSVERTEESIDARVDPCNRRSAPNVPIANRPIRERFATDAEYFIACDEWADTLPRAADYVAGLTRA